MERTLIFICVTNTGTIRAELIPTLIHFSHNPNYDVKFYFPNIVPLDASRNVCVEEFLKISNHEDDRLLFIDDDMVVPKNGLDILMNHSKDIVGLLCFMCKPNDHGLMVPLPVACRYNEDKKYIVYFDGEGLTEVDALGGACIMIKRKVFESIGTRVYEYQYYPNGTLSLVADYFFCQKAQEKGYKIYVDFNNTCGHIKEIDLREINRTMLEISRKNS